MQTARNQGRKLARFTIVLSQGEVPQALAPT
jgi:hypothetical protein